jgi:hypothetical protein
VAAVLLVEAVAVRLEEQAAAVVVPLEDPVEAQLAARVVGAEPSQLRLRQAARVVRPAQSAEARPAPVHSADLVRAA